MLIFSGDEKCSLLFALLLMSNASVACPDGYQPGGLKGYGNPYGCMPVHAAEAPAPQRPTTWVHSYAAVAWHPQAADEWAVWNARGQQGGANGAARVAINTCTRAMGPGCTLAMTTANGAIAVARRFDGILLVQSGASKKEAKENVLKDCTNQKQRCTYIKAFHAKPWVEYVEGPRYDNAEYYDPAEEKGDVRHNLFGAVAWTESGQKPWAESVWARGGHATYEAAGNAVVASCQKDSGATCKLAHTNINGVIVVAVDDQSSLRITGEQSVGAAEKWAMEKCKITKRKCSIAARFDTQKSEAIVFHADEKAAKK